MIINNDIGSVLTGIKEYFETYVKSYIPYKDNAVYRAILDTLIDVYYKNLYIDIPEKLIKLTVNNIIDITNIDYFLAEIGLPDKVIREFTSVEKWIFFQLFTDFTRYKSTVQFFQLIGQAADANFPEKFSIYELWIDRIDATNWVLKPIAIYTNSDIKLEDLGLTTIAYDQVYQKLPSLLIAEDQLEQWYQQRKLILPLKSNLILLVQLDLGDVDIVKGLIRASFLKTYGDFQLSLYFTDKKFISSLSFIDYLWFYLVYRYYGSIQIDKDFGSIILFTSKNPTIPLISQLPFILQQYGSINSWDEYNAFYEAYIRPLVVDYHQDEYTVQTLHDNLYSMSPEIMTYIDNRLSAAEDEKEEIFKISDELYGSLLLSILTYQKDENYQRYIPLYMETLSKMFVGVDIVGSYMAPKVFTTKIVLNLKPFHTDVLFKTYKAVKANDKEYINDKFDGFIIDANAASLISLSDQNMVKLILEITDLLSITTEYLYNHNIPIHDIPVIDDLHIKNLISHMFSILPVSDISLMQFSTDSYVDTVVQTAIHIINMLYQLNDNISLEDIVTKFINVLYSSDHQLSDVSAKMLNIYPQDSLSFISNSIYMLSMSKFDSGLDMDDTFSVSIT